jgi:hemerythrin
MAVQWTQALAVGHDTIDAQHQELFRRLNALLAAMMKGDRAEVPRLFDFLGSYVREHFGMEEALMREAGYPGRVVHCAAHERFVRDYLQLKETYEKSGGGAVLTIRLQTWIVEWLKGHIGGTDLALAQFLARRAA